MKMKLLGCLFISSSIFAQYGVNTVPPHGSSVFDMSDSKQGFLGPRVALTGNTDETTIPTPKNGLLIFNTTENDTVDPGYYYWNYNKWEPFQQRSSSQIVDTTELMYASTLGYSPVGSGLAAPESFTFDGITATKKSNGSFTDTFPAATTHYYVAYDLDARVSWEQAFNLAKFLQGYLVVPTTTNEWNFIKENLLNTGGNSGNNAWIGYNTIKYPGNPIEFTWITGEKSTIHWSDASVLETNYDTNQPNETTGCVRISPSSNVDRKWFNNPCTSTDLDGAPINYLIVEFNN